MTTILTDLDPQDQEILRRRIAALAERDEHPNDGDWVHFATGAQRRVSAVWRWDDEPPDTWMIQTSDEGQNGARWYLGENGYVSFSGGLYPGVPRGTLTRMAASQIGTCWFFHHDLHRAYNGIDTVAAFAVWSCDREAPR